MQTDEQSSMCLLNFFHILTFVNLPSKGKDSHFPFVLFF